MIHFSSGVICFSPPVCIETPSIFWLQNKNLVFQDFFHEQLRKHDKEAALIEQNLSAQSNILQAVTETNAKYANVRQALQETNQRSD